MNCAHKKYIDEILKDFTIHMRFIGMYLASLLGSFCGFFHSFLSLSLKHTLTLSLSLSLSHTHAHTLPLSLFPYFSPSLTLRRTYSSFLVLLLSQYFTHTPESLISLSVSSFLSRNCNVLRMLCSLKLNTFTIHYY